METALAERRCVACHGGMPALTEGEIAPLLAQLAEGWRVEGNRRLIRTYRVPDFLAAVAFVDRIAPIVEEEGHHPILRVSWGAVRVDLWTHAIDALTDNDFILAAKFDRAYGEGGEGQGSGSGGTLVTEGGGDRFFAGAQNDKDG